MALQILLVFFTHHVWAQDSVRVLQSTLTCEEYFVSWLGSSHDSLFHYNWSHGDWGNPTTIYVCCRKPGAAPLTPNFIPTKAGQADSKQRSRLHNILFGNSSYVTAMYTHAESFIKLKEVRRQLLKTCFGDSLGHKIIAQDLTVNKEFLLATLAADNIADPIKYLARLYSIAEAFSIPYNRIKIYYTDSTFLIYEEESSK
ncbi:MAG: hypothetical protein RL660_1609 [Bacteroidota bacterium]|jgi:hypothetical protein